ncbi:MAG: DsrE family protein [archaeon]|nr:DsrE family protein [archaeon]
MSKNQQKFALFAFQGEIMCFAHVLLNALDLNSKEYDVKIIIEGSSTKLIKEFHNSPEAPFFNLYKKVKDLKLIDAVCFACATKMGSIEEVKLEGLPIKKEMSGHPSISEYIEKGYTIITF